MKPLTYATVCTGVGGIDLGFERAGMRPLWFCEKDRQCREVLRYHWRDVPIYHDMQTLDLVRMICPDVMAGGTPCQGFSWSGLRLSLLDDRSNLCLTYVRLANYFNPRILVWENVPGVLSEYIQNSIEEEMSRLWKSSPCQRTVRKTLHEEQTRYAVRRLVPTEYEALQAFPRDFTLYAVSEKTGVIYQQKDSPRYKQMGNSVTTTVPEWIGHRINKYLNRVDTPLTKV